MPTDALNISDLQIVGDIQRAADESQNPGQDLVAAPSCLDPAKRKALVDSRPHLTPKFVYNMWISIQSGNNLSGDYHFLRAYSSSDLAIHDAICWLHQQHLKNGIQMDLLQYDHDYLAKTHGMCLRLRSDPAIYEQLGVMWSVQTTEEHLY